MSEWLEKMKITLHNRIKIGTVEFHTPNGERILMKYGGFKCGPLDLRDWHAINPPVIEENGKLKMIWSNFWFGGWRNLFKLLGILAIFGIIFFSVNNLFDQYKVIMNNTCVINCLKTTPIYLPVCL